MLSIAWIWATRAFIQFPPDHRMTSRNWRRANDGLNWQIDMVRQGVGTIVDEPAAVDGVDWTPNTVGNSASQARGANQRDVSDQEHAGGDSKPD